jgi:SAM-dependent methyltransferase
MEPLRKPLQGLWNVVRFNWHFYLMAVVLAVASAAICLTLPILRPYTGWLPGLLLAPVVGSLAASAYVYDFSGLYHLTWLPATSLAHPALLTVNAGFDEISVALHYKYSPSRLLAVDFYDPARHTEVSIKRARRAYPPYPGTLPIDSTAALPVPDSSIDLAFAFLAAHEIRDADERTAFFREIGRVLKPSGQVFVTEHLRDPANFLAYTIGFLHFYSRRCWLATFHGAGLHVEQEIRITPFITTFVLCRHGSPA